MKFRRNVKAEKLFNKVALLSLIAEIVLVIYYLVTFNKELIRFIVVFIIYVSVIFCNCSLVKKKFC